MGVCFLCAFRAACLMFCCRDFVVLICLVAGFDVWW